MTDSQNEVFRLSDGTVRELVANVIAHIGRNSSLQTMHVAEAETGVLGVLYQCSEAVRSILELILTLVACHTGYACQLRSSFVE